MNKSQLRSHQSLDFKLANFFAIRNDQGLPLGWVSQVVSSIRRFDSGAIFVGNRVASSATVVAILKIHFVNIYFGVFPFGHLYFLFLTVIGS